MANLIVTGGYGFIGTHLLIHLLNNTDYKTICVDVETYASQKQNIKNYIKDHPQYRRRIVFCKKDISNAKAMDQLFTKYAPEGVINVAAESHVDNSITGPAPFIASNIVGTFNLLECCRKHNVSRYVQVSTDEVYGQLHDMKEDHFTEQSNMQPSSVYSASKAAAEIAFASYARSYFAERKSFGAASARAGNVIGGGDWSSNRIIPDCIRSLMAKGPIELRNPHATRPWQHVLEPLSGYITLGSKLLNSPIGNMGSWNFGPPENAVHTVQEVTENVLKEWGSGTLRILSTPNKLHEAVLLQLNCDKARVQLGWKPKWDFSKTIHETIKWYKQAEAGVNTFESSSEQLKTYEMSAND